MVFIIPAAPVILGCAYACSHLAEWYTRRRAPVITKDVSFNVYQNRLREFGATPSHMQFVPMLLDDERIKHMEETGCMEYVHQGQYVTGEESWTE